MDYYFVIYRHWHGVSTYLVSADHEPGDYEIALALNLELDPDKDQCIEVRRLDVTSVFALPKKKASQKQSALV